MLLSVHSLVCTYIDMRAESANFTQVVYRCINISELKFICDSRLGVYGYSIVAI